VSFDRLRMSGFKPEETFTVRPEPVEGQPGTPTDTLKTNQKKRGDAFRHLPFFID
jgi:hypothetical protein